MMSRQPNTTLHEETHNIQCLYVLYDDEGRAIRRCATWLPYSVDADSGTPQIYCARHGGHPGVTADEAAWTATVVRAYGGGTTASATPGPGMA